MSPDPEPNRPARLGLLFGIVALVLPIVGGAFGVPAIVFGYQGLRIAAKSENAGKLQAILGTAFGAAAILLSAILLAVGFSWYIRSL